MQASLQVIFFQVTNQNFKQSDLKDKKDIENLAMAQLQLSKKAKI